VIRCQRLPLDVKLSTASQSLLDGAKTAQAGHALVRPRYPECLLGLTARTLEDDKAVPSSLFGASSEKPSHDAKPQPESVEDKWRFAAQLVQQLREAGLDCELERDHRH